MQICDGCHKYKPKVMFNNSNTKKHCDACDTKQRREVKRIKEEEKAEAKAKKKKISSSLKKTGGPVDE